METKLPQVLSAAPISRRAFFKKISAGFLATALFTLDQTGTFAQPTAKRKSLWTRAAFEPHTGERFTVQPAAGAKLKLTLTQVQEGSNQVLTRQGTLRPPQQGEAFVLVFSGPRQQPLSQDTYRFKHPTLGKFSLFIVPGAVSEKHQHYVAIVNRISA